MEMTLEQVIKAVRDNLSGIQVPVAYVETIGAQILGAVRNLDSCLDAINKAREEDKKEGSEKESVCI